MWLQRNRYRRDTIAGKKAAQRAAERKRLEDAAVVIQKNARRWRAQRKVRAPAAPSPFRLICQRRIGNGAHWEMLVHTWLCMYCNWDPHNKMILFT